jgi:CBS-domain-containing membrane protein
MSKLNILDAIGLSRHKVSLKDNIVSAVGGFLAILTLFASSYLLLDPLVAIMVIPSMGSSAVLLFASPHAPFSQPWNLVVGHLVSAIIGIMCWQWIPNMVLAASISVGLAIAVMYWLRCIHPPGGATALAAVIGLDTLHNVGYQYELELILLNVLSLLIIAIVFNAFFKKRHYPSHRLFQNKTSSSTTPKSYPSIKHEDFVFALSQIDTLVDIDEDDLLKIYDLATKNRYEKSCK